MRWIRFQNASVCVASEKVGAFFPSFEYKILGLLLYDCPLIIFTMLGQVLWVLVDFLLRDRLSSSSLKYNIIRCGII